MFQDTHLVFGVTVGSVIVMLGVFLLALSTTGWSLIVIGFAVAAIAIVFRPTTVERKASLDTERVHHLVTNPGNLVS
ncbi:hypothetical protein [Oceanicoccus sp. KOV_DT_Chl]|uniref:hypothetical protein n=1 Tax=Oceanicoccus sp. KOV_DT_Chl TaxID=1904639 RepID=UPI000C7E38DE|nr:hypothetical protein [Oceanicoccus sp. KOV_DT_Chl]